MQHILNANNKTLDLATPQVMGIVNLTPDSFSDGGKFNSINNALAQVEQMLNDGVNIIDLGGESTRPGAPDVVESEELNRVIPVLKAIKKRFEVIVSVDTSKAKVMAEALHYDVDIINDVCALKNEGCLNVVAQTDIPVCLMHMQGSPRTMQQQPSYNDIIEDIKTFFQQRINACQQVGIDKKRLILDVGFGFGKTLTQNYHLLANLSKFHQFNLPLLSGTSRKSMIGNLLNCNVEQRLAGSLTTAILAAQQGAQILRVHDVKETVDALKVLQATTDNKLLSKEN